MFKPKVAKLTMNEVIWLNQPMNKYFMANQLCIN